MRRLSFKLPVKPFSINAMYYRDQRIKTTEARRWTEQIFDFIAETSLEDKFAELKAERDRINGSFGVRITAHFPKAIFRNKQGDISARTLDVSNFEKPLIDLLFLPKYYPLPAPEGCRNMNCDDKYITALISEKKETDREEPFMTVSIWVRTV